VEARSAGDSGLDFARGVGNISSSSDDSSSEEEEDQQDEKEGRGLLFLYSCLCVVTGKTYPDGDTLCCM